MVSECAKDQSWRLGLGRACLPLHGHRHHEPPFDGAPPSFASVEERSHAASSWYAEVLQSQLGKQENKA